METEEDDTSVVIKSAPSSPRPGEAEEEEKEEGKE
jgi:hypothetical protein